MIKKMTGLTAAVFLCLGLTSAAQAATTYYIRTDGGTDIQCTGRTDAAYPGSGNGQACAYSHPFYVLSPAGSPSRMVGGDTMIIGPGQYMMGLGAENTPSCSQYYPWDCSARAVPSGTATNPTRILGKGYDTGCSAKPQLWGTERSASVFDLRSSSNVELQCLEITDHSSCIDSGPDLATRCNRDNYPFGPWAMIGIVASDSQNVLLKNLHVHGLRSGILAGRIKDWTIEKTNIIANSFVGWDGDIGANESSNSGTIKFKDSKIQWSGCGETYPGLKPHHCYSQDQGGYGDGLGTHKTGGNWIFDHVDFSYNVSDGLDLLYHNGNGTIDITHSRFEGNAGNQVKVAATTVIQNSKMIGNCAFFNGKSFTSTTDVGFSPVAFNNCRAAGNTIAIEFHPGVTLSVYNSTVTGNGDVLIQSGGSGCLSTEKVVSKNNIYIGGPEFNNGGEDVADLYYAAGATGNGDGTCGNIQLSTSNDIIWGTKYNNTRCTGTTSKCLDPKIVGPLSYTGDNQDVALQQTSPAVKSGVVMTNVSRTDFNNFDRGANWDIGCLQYGSVPTALTDDTPAPLPSSPVCGNGILETGEQCDSNNLNNQTCLTQGFVSGALGCTASCTLNKAACLLSVCGNGKAEANEQCDGADLAGQTCGNNGFAAGTMSCLPNCTLNTSACLSTMCGNGAVESGEQCDGTNLNSMTCSKLGFSGGTLSCSSCAFNTSGCTTAVCGNGILESGEQCDGTNFFGKTCVNSGFAGGSMTCLNCRYSTSSCLSSICGNGKLETGEQCDSANLNNQTCASNGFAGGTLSCSSVCTLVTSKCLVNVCGNGVKETGEVCDDGNTADNDGCSSACRSEYCGDAIKQTNELCDDGNMVNGDGCSALCKLEVPVCGNGAIEGTEKCDDGNTNNNDGCSSTCRPEYCGDGVKQANEGCDDGNWVNRDGCSALCKSETVQCGNGVIEGTERCDDGNTNSNDGCSSTCRFEYCGDGVKQANEGCDDGNWVNRDGCSALCKVEHPVCGNSYGEYGEQCDGDDFKGQSCLTQGFSGGTLSCTKSCTINTTTCTGTKKRPARQTRF